jgi:peptide/nickel transport system substrate-binding protein
MATLVASGGVPPMASATSIPGAGAVIPLLRVGTTFPETSLDPTDTSSCCIVDALSLETLLQFGPQSQLEPELATSWAQIGPVTYVYHLRRGVAFWDGNPLTAADVAYSWNYERAPGAGTGFAFASVKSITPSGPSTLVVTLTHPDPSWQYTPAENWSEIFEMKFAETHKGSFGKPGVLVMGTGPWEPDSLDPTRGAELSANPHWWGGTVPVQHVSFKFFSSTTNEALAFRAGELDLDPFISGPKSFAATSDAKIVAFPSCLDAFFSMNTQTAPWNDVHVRRAVAYALDRSQIIAANQGYAAPDYTLIPPQTLRTVASQSQVNALLNSLPKYPYNLAKAKAEMAESHYPHGFTTTLPQYDYGSYLNISQVIAAELQKIGIHAQIKVLSENAYFSAQTGPASKRQTSFVQGGCVSPDASGYDAYLGSANLKQGEYNYADYAPQDVDKLLAAGLATSNPSTRFPVYSKLLQRLATDVPYVPLFLLDYSIALSKKFTVPAFNQPGFQFDDYALQIRAQA